MNPRHHFHLLCLPMIAGLAWPASAMAQSQPGIHQEVPSDIQINITPRVSLRDQPLDIRVHGLRPLELVTLRAFVPNLAGCAFSASAAYHADVAGNLVVNEHPAISGSYRGIDGMGLITALSSDDKICEEEVYTSERAVASFTIEFTLIGENGRALGKSEVTRHSHVASQPTAREPWRTRSSIGTLYYPARERAQHTVLVLPGANGGIPAGYAEMLAAHGYTALALAYFGLDGLPPTLDEIPLEYFTSVIDELLQHPRAVGERVVVIGTSKGGELSLVLAAHAPAQIKAVVAYSPSALVWNGLSATSSSWTVDGQVVPFLFFDFASLPATPIPPFVLLPAYINALKNSTDEDRDRARIAVENIDGPVLMLSGTDDRVWPAVHFGDMVANALARHDHPYPVVHHKYRDAGHMILAPAYRPAAKTSLSGAGSLGIEFGGTLEVNAHADADAWRRVLDFLQTL